MTYTIQGHQESLKIFHQTARNDLFGLAQASLLEDYKQGKSYYFECPSDLENRLKNSDDLGVP